MKNSFLILCSVVLLSSCGTSQFLKDDISTLKSKVYHLEVQNKELTNKVDVLTQKIAIQENNLKAISQELKSVRSDLNKQIDTPIAVPIQSSTKKSSTKNTASTKSNSSKVSGSSATYSGRCQAITKKGTQCKRMAQAGRKYCWQH